MSADNNLSENEMNKSKFADINENFTKFKADNCKGFLNCCKKKSEIKFQSKTLQTFDGSKELGKSKKKN